MNRKYYGKSQLEEACVYTLCVCKVVRHTDRHSNASHMVMKEKEVLAPHLDPISTVNVLLRFVSPLPPLEEPQERKTKPHVNKEDTGQTGQKCSQLHFSAELLCKTQK